MRWSEWKRKSVRDQRTLALVRPRPAVTTTSSGHVTFSAAPTTEITSPYQFLTSRVDPRLIDWTAVVRTISTSIWIDFFRKPNFRRRLDGCTAPLINDTVYSCLIQSDANADLSQTTGNGVQWEGLYLIMRLAKNHNNSHRRAVAGRDGLATDL